MASDYKPTHLLKYYIEGDDRKPSRSFRIGAMWSSPDGSQPGRIKLDYIPVGFDGYVTVWPCKGKGERSEP